MSPAMQAGRTLRRNRDPLSERRSSAERRIAWGAALPLRGVAPGSRAAADRAEAGDARGADASGTEGPASLRPAFQVLGAALRDGDEQLARSILARTPRSGLSSAERAFLEACERVLTGRELAAGLALALRTEPQQNSTGGADLRLVLELSHSGADALTLRLPPADLEHLQVAIDELGIESRRLEVQVVAGLEAFVLQPGVPRAIELARPRVEAARALAVRDRWQLVFRSGEIERKGEAFPARELASPRFELVTLSSTLPPEPVPPEQLVEAVADPERPLAELLALGVRVPKERQVELLSLLAAEVERLSSSEPERLARIAPLLRWVTRAEGPGASPEHWAEWFRDWRADAERARSREGADERLDLPLPRATLERR